MQKQPGRFRSLLLFIVSFPSNIGIWGLITHTQHFLDADVRLFFFKWFLFSHLVDNAQLVCSRLMFHLKADKIPAEAASTTSGVVQFDLAAWQQAFQQLNPNLGRRMYFL